LEGYIDSFQVSLDNGVTWRPSDATQEQLYAQPFIIRLNYRVSNPYSTTYLNFYLTMLLNGKEQWTTSFSVSCEPHGETWIMERLDYNLAYGVYETGQWGLKVVMYGGTSPNNLSLLRNQTFNPVLIIRPEQGVWLWENTTTADLASDGTRPASDGCKFALIELPAQVTSGRSFRTHFWASYWTRYPIKNLHLDLMMKNYAVASFDYAYPTLPAGGKTEKWRKYGFAFYIDFTHIESILRSVPQFDVSENVVVGIRAYGELYSSDYYSNRAVAFGSLDPYLWKPYVVVPQVQMDSVAFPVGGGVIKRDETFSISLRSLFQPTIKETFYIEDYVEAEYLGVRKRLWTRTVQSAYDHNRLNTSWRSITISSIDIESILGPVTQSQRYAMNLVCGTLAAGTILGPSLGWRRISEAVVALNPYVAISPPIPQLMEKPDSLFPLPSVYVDELTQIIIGIQNFGSEGVIYLELNGVEKSRWTLGYLQSGFWDSGVKTIGQIIDRNITETEEVQLNFVYGFIDASTGEKVPSPARGFSVLVFVPLPAATLWGYIKGQSGVPVEGAIMVVGDQGGTSDSTGRYEVGDLVAKLYGFSCQAEGYQVRLGSVSLKAGSNRLDITLNPAEEHPSKFPAVPVALGLTGVVILTIAMSRRSHGK